MNKLDRPSRDPLELLDELESVLGIGAFPMNWPLGSGDDFKGVYDRRTHTVHCFERAAHGATRAAVTVTDVHDERLASNGERAGLRAVSRGHRAARRRGRTLRSRGDDGGATTPVFFGSAVTNFGVQLFLDEFVEMAPLAVAAGRASIHPAIAFTGFVFKIQANMDPRHRDRVAFVRVCSGEFARDMTVRNARTGAELRLSRAMRLFADDRESLETAYAGDVVGLANPGAFAIGDTLYEGEPVRFPPIPAFAPEHFASVRSIDVSGYKSFGKGISQLREEGAVQVFYPWGTPRTEPILGAVGELQFEVAKYRLGIGVQGRKPVHDAAVRAGAARRRAIASRLRARICLRTPSSSRIGTAGRSFSSKANGACGSRREWNPQLRLLPFSAQPGEEAVA